MKTITKIRCYLPFTELIIARNGHCFSCCPAWTKLGPIGQLTKENSIWDVWNSKKSQMIRQALLDDDLKKYCNQKYCDLVIQNKYFDLENFKTEDKNLDAIIQQIKIGKTILDTPPYMIESAYSPRCNLKCVMCHSHDGFFPEDKELDEIIFKKKIPEVLPGVSKLRMAGGEPLLSKNTREFLQNLDPALYPSLKISFITNGLLFTPKLWETIKHNNFDHISVSVDAASKTTYEYIRKNGNWDILCRNLEFIAALRKEWTFKYFVMTFIVMKSNYKEMKDFVQFGTRIGCDLMYFQKIFGYGDTRENINFIKNIKIFKEIAEILHDPVFTRYDVITTVLETYKTYKGKEPSSLNDFLSTVKGNIFYHPGRFIYKFYKLISEIGILLKRKKRSFY